MSPMKTQAERDEARRICEAHNQPEADPMNLYTFAETALPALLDAYEELEREREVLRRALEMAGQGHRHAADMWTDKASAEMEAEDK